MTEDGLMYAKVARDIEVGNDQTYNEAHIFHYVQRSSAAGNGCATFVEGRRKLCGVECPLDRAEAARLFTRAYEQGCTCSLSEGRFHGCILPPVIADDLIDPDNLVDGKVPGPDCAARLLLSVQCAFGLIVKLNQDLAEQFASSFSKENMRRCAHRVMAETLNAEVYSNSSFLAYFADYSRKHNFRFRDVTDEELNALWKYFAHYKKEITIVFLAFRMIAEDRGWPAYTAWRRRSILSEADLLEVSIDDLKKSHAAIGLAQNVLSREGVPLPNRYLLPSPPMRQWLTTLDGLQFDTSGSAITSIGPIGEMASDAVALMSRDDFIVALCLAFLEENPHSTSISLDFPTEHFCNPRCSSFYKKCFTPQWLAATDFGGSLYCADFMAGRFDSGRGTISFQDPLHLSCADEAAQGRGYFVRYSPEHATGGADSSRICLSLYSMTTSLYSTYLGPQQSSFFREGQFYRSYQRSDLATHSIKFDTIGFRIDGSGVDYSTGFKEAVFQNDPSHSDSHAGLSLTNRLDKIEGAFPVFRRVKYLLALTRCLVDLREQGLSLSSEITKNLLEIRSVLKSQAGGMCLLVAHP